MLCTVSHQSYKTHQCVPQVAAEHLDLTSVENSVLPLLLLSLWPRNDSNPVFWEKRGSDWTPCPCLAHLSCEELEFCYSCPKLVLILFPVFLQSAKLMDAFWRSSAIGVTAGMKALCSPQRCQPVCVTGSWSYQHVKCALAPLRADSHRRAGWQEWLLKACRWSMLLSSVGMWSCLQLPCLS